MRVLLLCVRCDMGVERFARLKFRFLLAIIRYTFDPIQLFNDHFNCESVLPAILPIFRWVEIKAGKASIVNRWCYRKHREYRTDYRIFKRFEF